MYSNYGQYSKIFRRDLSLDLWAKLLRPNPLVCLGYARKRWSAFSVLAVQSHKEWTWLIHFQFLRLWKSFFLIICRNWVICVRYVVVLSQLLNSNFNFYKPCILGSKEKQIKEIQLYFRGDYFTTSFRTSYIYEWNKSIQVRKARLQSQSVRWHY